MKKRGLSIFLALVLCLTLLPSTTWAAGEDTTADTWDGVADTSWYTNHEDYPSFTISTAEQLDGLAQLVNSGTTFSGKTITLGADIDLNGKEWMPIGKFINNIDWEPAFQGTFDGNGNTVSGLCVNITAAGNTSAGLFGYVSGGTVQNVNVDVFAGGVVGRADTGSTVDNCSFSGAVTGTGTNHGSPCAGGVVGRASSDSDGAGSPWKTAEAPARFQTQAAPEAKASAHVPAAWWAA